MIAAAPAASAWRLSSRQAMSPSAVVPATTGTRPPTCSITVSNTSARSRSLRRATSLVTPSAVSPSTPAPTNRSTTLRRLATSTRPSASNGVGRTEKTPVRSGLARSAMGLMVARTGPRSGRVQVHGLDLGEELAGRLALLAGAAARALEAAEGHLRLRARGLGVDVDDAGLDRAHEAQGQAQVARDDGGAEA